VQEACDWIVFQAEWGDFPRGLDESTKRIECRMSKQPEATLVRQMGLMGLVATGICSMVGAAINIIPIMLQRNVPGIGPYVIPAYLLAAIPAILAALAYAVLSSAMPRAGGSYVYATRALHPYIGFIASFSQWFGLSVAIGVVAYVLIPFLRDIATALGLVGVAETLEVGVVRVLLALSFVWVFAGVNVLGVKTYERVLVPLMILMFLGIIIVIPIGFSFDHTQFAAAVEAREGVAVPLAEAPDFNWGILLAASAVLFSSFIGFDSIAQAGGEVRDPNRTMPLAIGISVVSVGTFYLLFTAAVYHAVPWNFIAEKAQTTDLTAPGLLGYLLAPTWTVAIVAGATVGLINNFPALILATSRLMFAWAEDGVFPPAMAHVSPRYRTPVRAIVASCLVASGGILGSHLAGDFFLGVDILVTGMLINFLLMCVSVLTLAKRNPALASEIRFARTRPIQLLIGGAGTVTLFIYLIVHTAKDLQAPVAAWYLRSTWMWLMVAGIASLIFWREWRSLRRRGVDVNRLFRELPPQ